MVKFKITSTRFWEACGIVEYLNTQNKIQATAIRILPRFVVGNDGEYIVKFTLDEDEDIVSYEDVDKAFAAMAGITPKRLEKLTIQLMEAAQGIVNPTSERG